MVQHGFFFNFSKAFEPLKTLGFFDTMCTLQQMFSPLNKNNLTMILSVKWKDVCNNWHFG
jgi:hypothetical protein